MPLLLRLLIPTVLCLMCLTVSLPATARQDDTSAGRKIWVGVFTSEQAARGEAEYDRICSRCHNPELTGSDRGPAIKGSDFISSWDAGTLGGLFARIRDTMPQGNPGTVGVDIKADILAYILQENDFPAGTAELTTDLASLDAVSMAPRGIWDGVFTAVQAERGRAALLENGCNGCHGVELEGDRGPSLKGEPFMASWENASLNGLVVKIRDTMPPLNSEQVPVEEKIDIVAYLLEVNGFPAGTEDLSLDPDRLEQIQIAREGAEARGPQNFALVQLVGCLTQRPNSRWALTRATTPVLSRSETPTPDAIQAAASSALGTETFELVSVRSVFQAEAHRGHRMEARGLLYRDGDYAEVNLTSLEMVGSDCAN